MKKYMFFGVVLSILILLCIIFISEKDRIDIEGEILFNMDYVSSSSTITIYDCSKKEFKKLIENGLQAVFWGNDDILLNQFNVISKYNLKSKEETVIYHGESIDFVSICSDQLLSFSKDNYIFLYDINTKEQKILVQDNGGEVHSWSKNGNLLYYSDINGTIKSFDVLSGEMKKICEGHSPIVFGDNIAYKNKVSLIVENLETNEQYEYRPGSAYSYCFSPAGDKLLIEDEMSLSTVIKNIFSKGIVTGHSIIVWDYVSNSRKTVIDACVPAPNLICDWK